MTKASENIMRIELINKIIQGANERIDRVFKQHAYRIVAEWHSGDRDMPTLSDFEALLTKSQKEHYNMVVTLKRSLFSEVSWDDALELLETNDNPVNPFEDKETEDEHE